MRIVFLGASLVVMLTAAPSVVAAAPPRSGKTIKDLSNTIPLELFQRTVGAKFYQSLLASPLDDWSVVRAQMAGRRLVRPRVIRPAANPAYNTLALKYAGGTTLVADESKGVRQSDSALLHLLIYKIADGVMAVSFAHPEAAADQHRTNAGHIRLLVKTNEGPWTEIVATETQDQKRSSLHERGRRLRRMDRMPMDAISIPGR